MSDLSEFVDEHPLAVPVKLQQLFCHDCIPEVTVSRWPADAAPSLDRVWPAGGVVVVNTAHASTCPSFRAFVLATGAAVRFRVRDAAGFENLLFRETLSLDLDAWRTGDDD